MERCGLEPRTNFFFRLRNRQKLVRIRFRCGFDSRIYGITATKQEDIYTQGVPGGMCQTSGECSLC